MRLVPLHGPGRRLLLLAVAVLGGCGYEEALPRLPSPVAALTAAAREVVTLASPAQIAADEVVEGSYIVTFRSDLRAGGRMRSYLSEYRLHYAPLAERFMADPRVVDINYIDHVDLSDPALDTMGDDFAAPTAMRLALARERVMGTIAEVRFASNEAAASALADWTEAGAIWFAEPNYLSQLTGVFGDLKTKYAEGGGVWWHNMMNLPAAFDALENRNPPVAQTFEPVIAVLDSGLDVEHEAFNNPLRVWKNPAPGQSGCPGDDYGCDTTAAKKGTFGIGVVKPYGSDPAGRACLGDPDSSKNCPHGTHVAGIIAANWQGSYGGVCPFCKIMPIKIIAKQKTGGSASDAAILNGMKYLTRFVSNNQLIVRVVNSSFGKYSRSRSVSILVSVLSKADVLVIGAASNEESMQRTYPASLAPAIAVSALTQTYRKASYSNYGPWVDVAAPGGQGDQSPGAITSSNPGGGAINKSGTSMATPMVAGVAGLVLAVDPQRSAKSLRQSIVVGANPMIYNADVADGFNRNNYYPKIQGDNTRRPLLGSGVVDVKCAIEGTCKTGLDTGGKDRVTQGCSVVGGGRPVAPWALLLLALALPLAACLSPALRAGCAGPSAPARGRSRSS